MTRTWWAMTVAFVVAAVIVFLSFGPRPPVIGLFAWNPVAHAIGYVALTLVVLIAFVGSAVRTGPARRTVPLLATLMVFGIALEVLQGIVGSHTTQLADAVANVVGVLVGWTTWVLFSPIFARLLQRGSRDTS